jgi:FAD/FMN-containing dehydrogenase
MVMAELVDRWRSVVGVEHVLVDADVRAGYEVDWTGRFRGTTPAVVRPGSTEEVAAVVQLCAGAGVAIVPQGGNTGLVGGGVPLAGEIVLSTRRLSSIGELDPVAGQVTAGAGVTLGALQGAVAGSGWAVGIDLSARDSATIGGMAATNAGGLAFLRHGGMRQQVIGVEAVLGRGAVVAHTGGLRKDNTGYDLASLLCGSEGTLGIVTAVRLQLVPEGGARVTALASVDGIDSALAAVGELRRAGVVLDAAEIIIDAGMELVCERAELSRPLPTAPAYLLLEWEGAVDALGAASALIDAVVAEDATRRATLWRYREAQTEAINSVGVPHKLDVTLPLAALAGFAADVPAAVARACPGARTFLFGHVADGNIHVNVVGPPADDEQVDDAVLRLVAERGGSISAEHGIGTAKKRWLHLARSDAEIEAFRAIKRALDPAGILNPNALLP